MMPLATCGQCRWEIERPNPDSARKALATHERLRHPTAALDAPQAIPAGERRIPQLTSNDWRSQALMALRRLAVERNEFTVYDVADFGVGEPLTPRTDWGRLTRDAGHLGLIKHAVDEHGREKATKSKRPQTKSSLVAVWTAGPAIRRSA